MDRQQSLIIPLLFDSTNYAYWKVRMKAFLQSLDKKVWQVVEIGQTKPTEAPADRDDAKIKAVNFNSRTLNALFSTVTKRNSRKYPPLKLLRKHGPFSRQPIKELKLSRIQSFRGIL